MTTNLDTPALPISQIDRRMQELLGPLLEDERQLITQKEELTARLGEINNGLRRISNIKKVAFPEEQANGNKPRTRKKTETTPKYVGEERLGQIITFLKAQTEALSIKDIAEKMGFSEPSINAALVQLRAEERVRDAGKNNFRARTWKWMEGAE